MKKLDRLLDDLTKVAKSLFSKGYTLEEVIEEMAKRGSEPSTLAEVALEVAWLEWERKND